TPGFTKLINFFTINHTWRLVDLPGYGYAQLARKHSSRFNQATARYLKHRPNLSCVFALIDSGLEPQENDVEFVEWLARNAVPFVLVFTKTDKISAAQTQSGIKAFTDRIAAWFVQPPAVFTCSSNTGQGRQELLGVIEETLSAIQAQAMATPPEAATPPENSPVPGRKAKPSPKKRPDLARPW
ncbi:MAG TPA: GTP-binding protein 8, partial [Candidatus Binatia bacterium]|nr:GTP-binding protein 8 [Candidatus Binatia bacterium]